MQRCITGGAFCWDDIFDHPSCLFTDHMDPVNGIHKLNAEMSNNAEILNYLKQKYCGLPNCPRKFLSFS